MLQDTRRQQHSFDRESDKQDEGQSFQGSHPRRGDAKWGLVCICAHWEMPNCSFFHLENERLLCLAGVCRQQGKGWSKRGAKPVTASQNSAEDFVITHLANAPLGRQALVLRGSKCLGFY